VFSRLQSSPVIYLPRELFHTLVPSRIAKLITKAQIRFRMDETKIGVYLCLDKEG
jgi:hypothetical protein